MRRRLQLLLALAALAPAPLRAHPSPPGGHASLRCDRSQCPAEPTLLNHAESSAREQQHPKRWEGWDTTTVTRYVTATDEVPSAVTVYTTFGETQEPVDGGTTTVTQYTGADTTTVAGPSVITITLWPSTTTFSTKTLQVPTTTETRTQGAAESQHGTSAPTAVPERECLPGDEHEHETEGFAPTSTQKIMLYIIPIYIFVFPLMWSLVLLRDILFALKLVTVAIHELGHLVVVPFSSSIVRDINLDPNEGGYVGCVLSKAELAEYQALAPGEASPPNWSAFPVLALPFGYLSSMLVGGLYTFASFSILASKIASFFIGISLAACILIGSGIPTYLSIALHLGLLIGLWFVNHADGLRYYVLLVGVCNSFYVLVDVLDARVFQKVWLSCPELHAERLGVLTPGVWAMIYFGTSCVVFVGFLLAALVAFKGTEHALMCEAMTFLPT